MQEPPQLRLAGADGGARVPGGTYLLHVYLLTCLTVPKMGDR